MAQLFENKGNFSVSDFKIKYKDKYGEDTSQSFVSSGPAIEKYAMKISNAFKIPVEIWHYPDYANAIKLCTIFPKKQTINF